MNKEVRRARRGLAIYFATLVPLTVLFQVLIAGGGGRIADHPLLVFGLMWTPALGMAVARVALREGVQDVSFRAGFRAGGWREWLLAWLFPLMVGSVAYGSGTPRSS